MSKRKLCYLWRYCNKSSPVTQVPLIEPPAFHKFPLKNPLRATWMEMCGLDESIDDVSQLHICSNHFTAPDYININARQFGGVIKLHKDAYPTQLVSKRYKRPTRATYSSPVNGGIKNEEASPDDLKYTPPTFDIVTVKSFKHEIEDLSVENLKYTPPTVDIVTVTSFKHEIEDLPVENVKYKPPPPTVDETVTRIKTEIHSADLAIENALLMVTTSDATIYAVNQNEDASTEPAQADIQALNAPIPKSQPFEIPRYIGDLAPEHVATPKRARLTLQFIQNTMKKKNHQIKMLKQQNRRYVKKLKELQDQVRQLKRKSKFCS